MVVEENGRCLNIGNLPFFDFIINSAIQFNVFEIIKRGKYNL